jgi:hypothetical protein
MIHYKIQIRGGEELGPFRTVSAVLIECSALYAEYGVNVDIVKITECKSGPPDFSTSRDVKTFTYPPQSVPALRKLLERAE